MFIVRDVAHMSTYRLDIETLVPPYDRHKLPVKNKLNMRVDWKPTILHII